MTNAGSGSTPASPPLDRRGDGSEDPEGATNQDSGLVDTFRGGSKCELTDLELAERLTRRHGDTLRYCTAGYWLVWDDLRWARDDTLAVERLAKETVMSLRTEVDSFHDSRDRYSFEQRARQAESRPRIRSMIDLARSEPGIPISPKVLDRDRLLLDCPNGTIDLRAGALRPHDPEDLITRLIPVRYQPDAACPTWLGFLDRVCSGDPAMIRYLQRVAGYALTGETGEHCLFYLYGRGRNGKSVFLNTLQWLLGDYAIAVPSNLLTPRARDQHPTGLADLHGRRFVSANEIEDGSRLDESQVKSMTGGDSLRARHLYKDFFEFSPEFKLFIAANHKLVINGTDEGIWSRIRLIPFLETIPEEERDPRLEEKLHDEGEGILAWAVEGCMEWQKYGLYEPDSVRRATAEYRDESDSVGEFLASCCVFEQGTSIGAGVLFDTYRRWCYEAGRDQVTQKAFSRNLDERGIEKRKRSGIHRIGLRLREEAEEMSRE